MRILLLSNLPTPYQMDFLESLSIECEVRSVFLWAREANRDWTLQARPWLRILGAEGNRPEWASLLRELEDFRPDAVIVGGYRLPLANRLKWYCARKGIRYFYWLEKPLPATGVRAFMRSLLWRSTLPFASGVLCIGSDAVRAYGQYGAMTVNLPYAIDSSRYRVRDAGTAHLPLRCLFVGQYIERKGVQELLDAFAAIGPDKAVLTLVGSGGLQSVIEDYAARYGNIRNAGFVEPNALTQMFADHDVLVLPSRHDGWAVVVAEAMAAGLAVIGTRHTGAFVDLVVPNQCGKQCEVDAESIRRAVEEYIADPMSVMHDGTAARQALLSSTADARNAARLLLAAMNPR